jgi:hypothetical protein
MSKLGRCKLSAGFQRLIVIVTGIVSLIYLPSLIDIRGDASTRDSPCLRSAARVRCSQQYNAQQETSAVLHVK